MLDHQAGHTAFPPTTHHHPPTHTTQVCNHPFLLGEPLAKNGEPIGTAKPEVLVEASGKLRLMDRMLKRLKKQGHRVLIFSQMTEMMNLFEDYLRCGLCLCVCCVLGSRVAPRLPTPLSLPVPYTYLPPNHPFHPHPTDTPRHRKWQYRRIDGGVKIDERQQRIEEYNTDPSIFAFLLSTRAGGLGINLAGADTVRARAACALAVPLPFDSATQG